MGVDISHSLLVGCSYDELEDFIALEVERQLERAGEDAEEVDEGEILDDHFCSASPYYDADRELCFYGFRIPNNHEINEQWFAEVQKIADSFEELTGVKPRIRGGANVW